MNLVKKVVLENYCGGPAHCQECGSEDYENLVIDHITNRGRQHRRNRGAVGRAMYKWLLSKGCPPGYQVLCNEHNLLKNKLVKDRKGWCYSPNPYFEDLDTRLNKTMLRKSRIAHAKEKLRLGRESLKQIREEGRLKRKIAYQLRISQRKRKYKVRFP